MEVAKSTTQINIKCISVPDMLFHCVASSYMHYSQSYRALNTKG